MPRKLDVYLHDNLAGQLVQDDEGWFGFTYSPSLLGSDAATPLSHSLPLRTQRFNRKECRGFFAGLLPEQRKREVIAKNLGVSAQNDFALLERIGGECAGAVTFIPAGKSLPTRDDQYLPLTTRELAARLRELPRRPLMAGETGVRLSLAGAQDKIPVRVRDGQIFLPLAGAPSTHILKPAVKEFEGIVFNEFFCMSLAQSLGLATANVETGRAEGIDYLLVERYDRTAALDGSDRLKREHQEDFCQALGIVPEQKYQKEGGPSFKQCFSLLRDASSTPVLDLQLLLDAAIYNFLAGNHDAHGKNFSLLYTGEFGERQTRLAPLYDLVSTMYYPELSTDMAMRIGGEYLSDKVGPEDFEKLAEQCGLAKGMVKRRVAELAELALSKLPALPQPRLTASELSRLVQSRCERILKRFRP